LRKKTAKRLNKNRKRRRRRKISGPADLRAEQQVRQ